MAMRMLRPVIAIESLRHLRAPVSPGHGARVDPRLFGRRFPGFVLGEDAPEVSLSDDARLFLTSFAVGFVFVSVLIF